MKKTAVDVDQSKKKIIQNKSSASQPKKDLHAVKKLKDLDEILSKLISDTKNNINVQNLVK